MRFQNVHVMKSVVLDPFHIVGSNLWALWGITLKVYEHPNNSDTAALSLVIGLANVRETKP